MADPAGHDAPRLSAASRLALAVLLALPFFASAWTLILTYSDGVTKSIAYEVTMGTPDKPGTPGKPCNTAVLIFLAKN